MTTGYESVDLVGDRTVQYFAVAVVVAALTTAFAQVAVPYPLSPSPFTLQTVGVYLAGLLLGPVLVRDLREVRLAVRARGGDALTTRERIRTVSLVTVQRALSRSETLSVALRARCFSWNPTLPPLRLSRVDYPVLAAGLASR